MDFGLPHSLGKFYNADMSQTVLGSVNLFIIKGDSVLLGRRANTGWMDGRLCPPGGHIEPGESPTDAVLREAMEELGTQLRKEDVEFLCVAARNTSPNQYVAYEFAIKDKDIQISNTEPNKCSELVWVDLHALPEDIVPDFRSVIEQSIVGGKNYLELGFDS